MSAGSGHVEGYWAEPEPGCGIRSFYGEGHRAWISESGEVILDDRPTGIMVDLTRPVMLSITSPGHGPGGVAVHVDQS